MFLFVSLVVAFFVTVPSISADGSSGEPPIFPLDPVPGNLSVCGSDMYAWWENPMTTITGPISTNIYNKLSAAPNTIGGNHNGMSFVAANGYYNASLYQRFPSLNPPYPWNEYEGWWGAPFNDFAYVSWEENVNCLVYIVQSDPAAIWWVLYNLQTHEWYKNEYMYRSPDSELKNLQAVYRDGEILVAVQRVDDNSILIGGGSPGISQSADMWPAKFPDDSLFKPDGEFTMFWYHDEWNLVLWFYYVQSSTDWPRLTYTYNPAVWGTVMSTPIILDSSKGGYGFYNTTSVSAVVHPKSNYVMLMRTGFFLPSSALPNTLYFIMKLSSSPVAPCLFERVLTCCEDIKTPILTWRAPAGSTDVELQTTETSVSIVFVDILSGQVWGILTEPWPYTT